MDMIVMLQVKKTPPGLGGVTFQVMVVVSRSTSHFLLDNNTVAQA
jgi:hypothetical protein